MSSALYIHIPFCKQKCLYCDFPSLSGKDAFMKAYIEALTKELATVKDKEIATIFIGGGTPTYLSLEGLNILKVAIKKLKVEKNLEFTVEGNPGSFSKEKLRVLKEMGVNRLSIGLQAYNDNLLKTLGRIHTVKDFEDSYYMARNMGFDNINIDLMFGIPNQTLENWNYTLKKVVELKPEHLSCYSLIIEEGTPFYKMDNEDKLCLPSEDIERIMYKNTLDILKANEYIQYEISNFAKVGKECRHNLVYWEMEDYIACGSSAHGFIEGVRYKNEAEMEQYIVKINEKSSVIVETHNNCIEDNMEEFMFMGLRKIKGISTEEFKKRFNKDIHEIYEKEIKKHTSTGLLMAKQGRIYLTEKGIELSNLVMVDFIL